MSLGESGEKTTVIVVDNHPVIREALRAEIGIHPKMKVKGDFANAKDALPTIEQGPPDIVVLEISLGEEDGLTLIEEVRTRIPDVRLLVFSRYDESLYAARAVEAGASGYVMKSEPTMEVVRAIELICDGGVYLNRKIASRILSQLIQDNGEDNFPLGQLTDRELEVFRKIGEGYSVREIAGQLDLNRKTIETYRRRAKEKLGHDTVEDLLRHAVQWGGHVTREKKTSE